MKTLLKIIICTMLIGFAECKKDQDPKKIECGCADKPDIIVNEKGKIIVWGGNPATYSLLWAGWPTSICVDSTFSRLLTQNKIVDGDSIEFIGGLKDACYRGCDSCDPNILISITSMSKK